MDGSECTGREELPRGSASSAGEGEGAEPVPTTIGAGSKMSHKAGRTQPWLPEPTAGSDGMAKGGEVGSTFLDDVNLRGGEYITTSRSSFVLARFPIGDSASCGSSLLSTLPSYQLWENATLLRSTGRHAE